jgi:flagellar protein FliT
MERTSMLNLYLQKSANLYKLLTTIPPGTERVEFIEKVNELLDERELLVEQLKKEGFKYDENDSTHKTLFELDQGIQKRLGLVLDGIKKDLISLQNSKKNEQHYIDPYEKIRNLEGRYYDGKK